MLLGCLASFLAIALVVHWMYPLADPSRDHLIFGLCGIAGVVSSVAVLVHCPTMQTRNLLSLMPSDATKAASRLSLVKDHRLQYESEMQLSQSMYPYSETPLVLAALSLQNDLERYCDVYETSQALLGATHHVDQDHRSEWASISLRAGYAKELITPAIRKLRSHPRFSEQRDRYEKQRHAETLQEIAKQQRRLADVKEEELQRLRKEAQQYKDLADALQRDRASATQLANCRPCVCNISLAAAPPPPPEASPPPYSEL